MSAGRGPTQQAKMRGAGLSSQEEGVGRPLQTQLQRLLLTGSGLGQAGKAGAPQQRLWEGLRPGLCSWSSSSCDSVWPAHHQPPGDPEPPSLSGPALSRGDRMGEPELGWRCPAGGTRKRWGAGTLVLRAVCAGSEAGGERRKEVSLQPLKAVRKQGPSSPDLPHEGGSGQE